jgi:prophage regulatory protein
METNFEKNTRLLRLPELVRTVGLSRSQLYEMQRNGTFPHSIKLSARAVAWREADVLSWSFSRGAHG